jgi:catechol 2,3-dioxygenase-like lactoylglutathione lyase family enzyme
MKVDAILETCLYVEDLKKAEEFYMEVLGLEYHTREEGRHVFLRCGKAMLLLFFPDKTQKSDNDVPTHGAYGPGHVAFTIYESDYERWLQKLSEHGITVETEIEWPGGGKSIYFRDPDGNSLELATSQTWGFSQ